MAHPEIMVDFVEVGRAIDPQHVTAIETDQSVPEHFIRTGHAEGEYALATLQGVWLEHGWSEINYRGLMNAMQASLDSYHELSRQREAIYRANDDYRTALDEREDALSLNRRLRARAIPKLRVVVPEEPQAPEITDPYSIELKGIDGIRTRFAVDGFPELAQDGHIAVRETEEAQIIVPNIAQIVEIARSRV